MSLSAGMSLADSRGYAWCKYIFKKIGYIVKKVVDIWLIVC